MTDPRLDRFVIRLREEFPSYVVAIRAFESPEDPSIEFFVNILRVPDDDICRTSDRAWELTSDYFGEGQLSFLMTAVDKENSSKFYAKELAEFGRAG